MLTLFPFILQHLEHLDDMLYKLGALFLIASCAFGKESKACCSVFAKQTWLIMLLYVSV